MSAQQADLDRRYWRSMDSAEEGNTTGNLVAIACRSKAVLAKKTQSNKSGCIGTKFSRLTVRRTATPCRPMASTTMRPGRSFGQHPDIAHRVAPTTTVGGQRTGPVATRLIFHATSMAFPALLMAQAYPGQKFFRILYIYTAIDYPAPEHEYCSSIQSPINEGVSS